MAEQIAFKKQLTSCCQNLRCVDITFALELPHTLLNKITWGRVSKLVALMYDTEYLSYFCGTAWLYLG